MNRIPLDLLLLPVLVSAALPAQPAQVQPVPTPTFVAEFTDPALSPAHWTLAFAPDGSGRFHSDAAPPPAGGLQQIDAPGVDRPIQLTPDFARRAFEIARTHDWFNRDCESHLKVAFQGWKKLAYSGPEGAGACTFNFSRDKEIQALGDSLVGVAETLREGARLEMLLQHDRLGLDLEIQYLAEAAKDGRAEQLCVIRETLERLAHDDQVLDRVRKRALLLLKQPGT